MQNNPVDVSQNRSLSVINHVCKSTQSTSVGTGHCQCTRTSRHFLSLEDRQVVLHRLQVGGLQINLPLQAVDRVIDRVVRRIVLEVPTLLGGASHVFWAQTSSLNLPVTTVFAMMSCLTHFTPTPARTNRWHELLDTPKIVVSVQCLCRCIKFPFMAFAPAHELWVSATRNTILRSQFEELWVSATRITILRSQFEDGHLGGASP